MLDSSYLYTYIKPCKTAFAKPFISVTKSWIDLKPGCKIKFVRCLETYLLRLMILGPFYQGSPEISLAGSVLGSMKVKEGPLSPGRVPQ